MTVQPIDDLAAPTSVLDRVSTIVDAFYGQGPLTLSQIVIRTGLPRSSVHRFLENLVRIGWLKRTDGYYQLGMRLFELGTFAGLQDRVRTSAESVLHELYRVTGFVVHLAVLDGPEVVYLDKVGGRMTEAVPTRVGGRRAATTTALGRVLLAFGQDEDSTPQTADPGLRYVVDTGVAYEHGENVPGISCIAAPIGPAGGTAVAAVSICGPSRQLRCDPRNAAPVRMAASTIWKSLQTVPPRRRGEQPWHPGAHPGAARRPSSLHLLGKDAL